MDQSKSSFDELRSIILSDDRKEYADRNELLLKKIDQLEAQINEPEQFAELIKKSKAEVVDALGPHVGKLIKKFIRSEIERLADNIEQKRKAIFSFEFLKRKKNVDSMMQGELIQVFIIDKDSGLVIGEYAPQELLEPDLVASMLTAIKSFAENAFGDEDSDLESLEYSNYKVTLFNFNKFYFALVINGIITPEKKSDYYDHCLNIADNTISELNIREIDDELKETVNTVIQETFFTTKEEDEGDQ